MRAILVLIAAVSTGTATNEPPWLVEARKCVRIVRDAGEHGTFTVDSWSDYVDAQQSLAAAPPPAAAELKQLLETDSAERAAALAVMALYPARFGDLVSIVATRYRRSDALPARYFGAKVLGSMTAEQVARHAEHLLRVAREELGTFVFLALGGAIEKLDPVAMVDLLGDVAIGGSPVVAYLTARGAGDSRALELRQLLERRRAVCALHAIQNLEFMMGQKGWPVEELERPRECRSP